MARFEEWGPDVPGAVPKHDAPRPPPVSQSAKKSPRPQPPSAPAPRSRIPSNADAEAADLLRRASWLGGRGRSPLVSYTSLFLAFLSGGDPVAAWVKRTTDEMRLDLPRLLAYWEGKKDGSYPSTLTIDDVRRPERTDAIDVTPSMEAILAGADAIRQLMQVPALGARHLFAALVFGSLEHGDDLAAWGLRVRSLAARYTVFLAEAYPEEGQAWREYCVHNVQSMRSVRLASVWEVACALATNVLVDVPDLVRALLFHARNEGKSQIANQWLLERLASDALSKLGVPGFPPPTTSGTFTPTPQLQDWLDTAQLYALTSKDGPNLRHVIAALLSPRGPASGKRMLRSVGADIGKLSVAFAEEMRRSSPEDDHATWSWLLANDEPQREIRKPGYASDVVGGNDLLSITGDVRALAAVLASADTKPPLSIGLFGNWGSGKTFFMHKLRSHIASLANESGRAARSAYCSQIAQVEFNAWHYLDGDLWANLISHVLDGLENYFRGDERSLADQRRQELAATQLKEAELERREREIDARRAAVEQEVASYQPTAADLAAAALGQVEVAVRDAAVQGQAEVRDALARAAAQLDVAPSALTIAEMRKRRSSLTAWFQELAAKRSRIALWLVVTLVATAATFVTAQVLGSLKAEEAVLLSLAAPALAVIERVIRVGAPIAKSAQQVVDAADRAAMKLARNRPDIFQRRKELDQQRADIAREREQLAKRSEDLRKLLDAATVPGMRDYVLQRNASAEYRDRLGIVASVHRDFQYLSNRLRDDTTDPKLQRIILYIDDLDRCPPKRVVEVLQAIHLLLSFELFVVVVAVDPNWLLRSLNAYYARQFPNESRAPQPGLDDWEMRPQFYLEKIFQIPYALRPMTAGKFDTMVGALLEDAVVTEPAPEPSKRDPSTPRAEPSPEPAPHARVVPEPPAPAPAPRLDLTPRNLELTQPEVAHLRTLGALVGSPRSAKRLANLYRIVRAGLTGDALDEFIDDHYQLMQIMLAAVVGCPGVAVPWFEHVLSKAVGDAAVFMAPVEECAKSDPRARFLVQRISQLADRHDWNRVVKTCATAARYSFETGPLLDRIPSDLVVE